MLAPPNLVCSLSVLALVEAHQRFAWLVQEQGGVLNKGNLPVERNLRSQAGDFVAIFGVDICEDSV